MNIQEIIEAIEGMSLLQVKELVDALKEKFGVTGAIAVAGGAAAPAAAAEEEKTEFDVVLKEAKEIVESAPKTIKEGVSKEEAEKIAEQFKAVGATVEIK